MKLNGIHHVSINVDNVDTARTFYVDVLGLELVDRPDLGFPGLWLRSGGQEIQLLGIETAARVKEQHLAFAVDDLGEVRRRLESHGVKISKDVEIPGVCVQAFAHDPSGNMIEFNQRV